MKILTNRDKFLTWEQDKKKVSGFRRPGTKADTVESNPNVPVDKGQSGITN